MVRSVEQVEIILNSVRDRVKVGLMLETVEALNIADRLNSLPIERFYVGLNDLGISRNNRNLFSPLLDGTIEELRPKITKKFGIAGLTHPDLGSPIPCSLLIKQMKNHEVSFSFLRRSFYKDLDRYTAKDIIASLRDSFNDISNETTPLSVEEIASFNQVTI